MEISANRSIDSPNSSQRFCIGICGYDDSVKLVATKYKYKSGFVNSSVAKIFEESRVLL